MVRIRWFHLKHHTDALLSLLGRGMSQDEYTEGAAQGFRTDVIRRHFIRGEFVERVDIVEEVTDPFGRVLSFSRVEFRRTAFTVYSGRPSLLEMRNPARGSALLLSHLGRFASFELAIEPVRTDLLKWMRALERTLGPGQVRSLEIDGIPLTSAVQCRAIISGGADVRNAAAEFRGKTGLVRRIEAIVEGVHGPLVLELFADGRATVGDAVSNKVLEQLRAAMASAY
jgi:hypothetical protein